MSLTSEKLQEREIYILNKMREDGRKWSQEYSHKIQIFLLEQTPYNPEIGYCGRGNSACRRESLSSKLVPDFKSKNFSCYAHDHLYTAYKEKLISKEDADLWFYFSMLYDAGWNPLKRFSAWWYYQAVKMVGVE